MTNTQTATNAVAQRETGPGALIKQYQNDFQQVLPNHIKPETFVRLSQGLLRRNPQLAEHAAANPAAFLAALLECARLGHEPGTDAYALVPFKDKDKLTIVGIEQYQGEIERMYRAGAATAIKARVVRQNDYYEFDETTMQKPDHRPGWYATDPPGQQRHARFMSDAERGELVGVYAYADLHGGAVSRVIEMGRDEVMRHKAVARGADTPNSPWKNWEASMWLKTAVHELEKWVPTSSEYRREQLRAAAEANNILHKATPPKAEQIPPHSPARDEVLDAELVDDPTPNAALWQQILTVADELQMDLPIVEQDFAAKFQDMHPQSATATQLDEYLTDLKARATA